MTLKKAFAAIAVAAIALTARSQTPQKMPPMQWTFGNFTQGIQINGSFGTPGTYFCAGNGNTTAFCAAPGGAAIPGLSSDGSNGITVGQAGVFGGTITAFNLHLTNPSGVLANIGAAPSQVATLSALTSQIQTSGYTAYDAFGTSITAGTGATSCNAFTGNCYVALLAAFTGTQATLTNYGVGGAQACDVTASIFQHENLGAASAKLITIDEGTNDANDPNSASQWPYYKGTYDLCQNAGIFHLGIPSTNKTTGASFGSVPTNWTLDTTYAGMNGLISTTNGAQSVWAYPTAITLQGQPLIVFYRIFDQTNSNGNGGTFTIQDTGTTQLGSLVGGTGYSSGTNVNLVGPHCTAQGTVTAASGIVTNVLFTSVPAGCQVGDVQVVAGGGGNASITITSTGNQFLISNSSPVPIATGNGATESVGALVLRSPTRLVGNFNLVITVTSATGATNTVSVLGIATIPPPNTSNGSNPMWLNGVGRQFLDAKSQWTAAYDNENRVNCNLAVALGIACNFVNIRNWWFGTQADMSTGLNQLLHPNAAGHLAIATAYENATYATTQMPPLAPNQAGPYRLINTAGNCTISASDSVLFINETAATNCTLLPNSTEVPPDFRGSGATQTPRIEVHNEGTGAITFVAAPGVVLRNGLGTSGLLPSQTSLTLSNIFNAPQTWWEIVASYGLATTQPYFLNQSTGTQAIQLGSSPTTSSYNMAFPGSTLAGWVGFSETGPSAWTVQAQLYSATVGPSWQYCGTVTVIAAPSGTCQGTYFFTPNLTNVSNHFGAILQQQNFTTNNSVLFWPDSAGASWYIATAPTGGVTVVNNVPTYLGTNGHMGAGLGVSATATGQLKSAVSIPNGTPTYTPGTSVTSVVCTSTFTCTNTRGELTIMGGTATTGVIATLNFSAALSAAPFCTVSEENMTALHGLSHNLPTTGAFTISAAVSVTGVTLTVDYSCQP